MLALILVLVWLLVAAGLNYADIKGVGGPAPINGFSPVWIIWPAILVIFAMALIYEATTGEKTGWFSDDD